MHQPLFSSYRAGENRVTSSTLAVFERIDLALVTELLASSTGLGADLTGVTFVNQVPGPGSVPDAMISAHFTWLFETKTTVGAYDKEGAAREQVRRHSASLREGPHALLIVLTPDPVRPAWFDVLDGIADGVDRQQVLWLGFRDLSDVIRQVVAQPGRVLGERTLFLLTELDALYEADGLLDSDDTVVVAARDAWPEYQRVSAYVCQPDRSFRAGLTHFGFYTLGAIQSLVPRIERYLPSVTFSRAEADGRRAGGDPTIADLIDSLLDDGSRVEGAPHGIVLLTGADDPHTVRLPQVIENDSLSSAGRRFAWTQWQRYTRLDRLRSGARVTSQL